METSNLFLNHVRLPYIKFNEIEVQIVIPKDTPLYSEYNLITLHSKDSKDLILLQQLKFILDDLRHFSTILHLPYVPFARYDRKFNKLDCLSLKVFANTINSLNFDYVKVSDPHSIATENLIDRCVVVPQEDLLREMIGSNRLLIEDYTAIVAPDFGASKKASIIASTFNKPLIQCSKNRSSTNSITESVIYGNLDTNTKEKYLIVDDIIEYGSTVVSLVQEIKKANPLCSVDIFMSHGILPVNNRLPDPSRFNAILEHVNEMYLYYLWEVEDWVETNSKVKYFHKF